MSLLIMRHPTAHGWVPELVASLAWVGIPHVVCTWRQVYVATQHHSWDVSSCEQCRVKRITLAWLWLGWETTTSQDLVVPTCLLLASRYVSRIAFRIASRNKMGFPMGSGFRCIIYLIFLSFYLSIILSFYHSSIRGRQQATTTDGRWRWFG